MTTAFQSLATTASLPLLHRYETRLHMLRQRALHNLLLLRSAVPNEPSPDSEHFDPPLALPEPEPQKP